MAFKPLVIGGPAFWWSASSTSDVYKDGDLYYVVFDDSTQMDIVRRTKPELFTITVMAASSRYALIVNGNQYDVTASSWTYRMGSDPIDPANCPPIGQVIESSRVTAGRSTPDLFYVAQGPGPVFPYSFGSGDPSGASPLTALGGLGPVIIRGLKYGNGNLYKPGTTGGPTTGDPGPALASSLIQRNNNTYISLATRGATCGKAVIAHSTAQKKLLVLCLPDKATSGITTGITLDDLRDKLFDVGVEDAVFLDGSDSVTGFGSGLFFARPGPNKDRTIPVGLGFSR